MKKVLLTRQDNSALAEILKNSGIETISLPLIECSYNVNKDDASEYFDELSNYSWLTFSSPNAVRGFFKAFFEEFDDIRSLGIARIACVGEATAKELKKFYIRADIIPSTQTGKAMAEAMQAYESLEHLNVLSVCGNLALPDLANTLDSYKAIVDVFKVYETTLVEIDEKSVEVKNLKKTGADVVVFASPSAVESFVKNAEKLALAEKAIKPKVLAIGTTTAEAVKKYGMKVAEIAISPKPEDIAIAVQNVI